ncbi:MAG: hypothetical protein J6Z74_06210 [Eubacterium sp.]|nr:hypothetical protein [Eubacterium sp.]
MASEPRTYRYNVKRRARRRITYRVVGLTIALLCLSPFIPFFMGYGKGHIIGLIFCGIFALYGLYIFAYSFSNGMYDISFVFNEDDFIVKNRKGENTHFYAEITKLDHIVPENENVYSIIHMVLNGESIIIPFTLKKSTCDTLYSFLMEKVTIEDVSADPEEKV